MNYTAMLKSVLLFIGGLLIGAGIGYLAVPKTPTPVKTENAVVTQKELPVGIPLLKDPMVYQWRGSVEGILTSKTTNKITLSKDAHTIDIPVVKATDFFGPVKNNTREKITLSQIPIGSYLRGEFFAFPWEGDKNTIKGSYFAIESQ